MTQALTDYSIRPATLDDLPVVLHHRRRMFEDMGFTDPGGLDRMIASSSPLLARGLRDGTYRGWLVAHAADGIVAGGGIIGLEFQPSPRDSDTRRWWMVNVYAEPAHRRKGLARWIATTIVDWGREAGLSSVNLHASDDARPLYEALGFTPTNEMKLTLR